MKRTTLRDAALFAAPLAFGGLLVAFALLLMNSAADFERRYDAAADRSLAQQTRLAADVLSPLLAAGRVDAAVAYCAAFDDAHTRVTLIDDSGAVLGDSAAKGEADNHLDRAEVAAAFAGAAPVSATRYSASMGQWMKYRAVAVGPGRRHVLRMATSVHGVSKALLAARLNLLAAFLLGLFIALGLFLYVRRNVRAPLLELEASVRKVAGGDLGAAIAVPRAGMFRETAAGVAEMLERLRLRLKEVEHAGEFRRDFIANVSHEIKTPLTCILAAAEALDSGALDAEERRAALAALMRNAARLDALVHDVLDLSEIENMEREGSAGADAADFSAAAERAAAEVRERAFAAGFEMDCRIERGVKCAGSERLLEQMVMNLADNAVKHSMGRRIAVELRRAGAAAELSVRDDGVGIACEHRARVFERFYRADKSRSRNSGGTGLGLSIVKHVALLHRGSVALGSSRGGSVFKVRIPALD